MEWLRNYPEDNAQTKLQGEAFRKFVRICAGSADEFSLMTLGLEYEPGRFEKMLSPWLIGTTDTDSWFGYGEGSSVKRVFRYRVTDGALDALFTCRDDIFLTTAPEEGADGTRILEDLCFFENGRLFFGSISHEEDCFLWPLDDQMRSEVESLDRWHPIDWRDERSRIALADYDWTGIENK